MKIAILIAATLFAGAAAHAAPIIPFSGTLSNAYGDGLFKNGDAFSGNITIDSDAFASYYDPDTNGEVYSWAATYQFSVADSQYPFSYSNEEGDLSYYAGTKTILYSTPGDSLGESSTMSFSAPSNFSMAGKPDLASLDVEGVPASFYFQGLAYINPDEIDGYPVYSNANGTGTLGAAGAVAAVPESASWIMMFLGFGAIGSVLRRAHRKSEERFTSQVRAIAGA
jgi:hypothetical protein